VLPGAMSALPCSKRSDGGVGSAAKVWPGALPTGHSPHALGSGRQSVSACGMVLRWGKACL